MSASTGGRRAGRGSVAGASGDAGVEYRRGVAAYAVAFGLAGVPLLGLGVPAAFAHVRAVALETDDAVDDIRVEFTTGWTAFMQAKRRLTKGKPLATAVAQWAKAAKGVLEPDTDRLVIVAGSMSGPMGTLKRVLEQHKTDRPGPPTAADAAALAELEELLDGLTAGQIERVLRCGVIHELAVEQPSEPGALQATSHLRGLVASGQPDDALAAWNVLTASAGHAARLRGGYELQGWLDQLRGGGIEIGVAGAAPAADLQRRHEALSRYRDRLRREGSVIDLRGLGAQIPPLPLTEADAQVRVAIDPDDKDDPKAEADLAWAFMRRGRIVLTGLPGGGKSTAIRMLAAQLCDVPAAPLPIRVSLKDVDAQDRTAGFRDRLLTAAVRDDKAGDRPLIRAEIERLLDAGGAALLLDSLDETYDRRADVVSEVEAVLDGASPDVDTLIATRDVAYGQAATLGWDSVRLLPPEHADRVVEAILRQYAAGHGGSPPKPDPDQWTADRRRWVNSALAGDATLRETPLLPVLLAILAADKTADTLPTGRAHILAAVVRDAVSRHELRRNDAKPLGSLTGTALDTAAMYAFASEASAILNANGHISLHNLVPMVAAEIAEHWDMAPGHADTTARDAIRFFDESGIFVMSGADESVAPRVALFAEIGDALRATTQPAGITAWVDARIAGRQLEPLILAAGLSHVAANALAVAAANTQDPGLLHAAVRAHVEKADLSPHNVRAICAGLINDIRTGTPGSWDSWPQLLKLPITADMRPDIETATAAHPKQHQQLARAVLDLRFRSRDELRSDPSSLLDVLALVRLPTPVQRTSDGMVTITQFTRDDGLRAAQTAAADILLGTEPAATALVAERASHGPTGLRRDLGQLLRDRGFETEADAASEDVRSSALNAIDWLHNYDFSDRKLLTVLADAAPAPLDYQQRTRLDELADLLETLDLNDASSIHMLKHDDEIPRVVELTAALYGFDLHIVGAQAALTLQRMDTSGDSAPYYALFDFARARQTPHWDNVPDREQAVQLLGRMFTWGRAHARFACIALWDAPVGDLAAPMLRDLLPRLASSTEHQRFAAHALTSLVDGPEPNTWLDSDNPVLRAVLAQRCLPGPDGRLKPALARLLHDQDGYVQEAALQQASEQSPPDLKQILGRAVAATAPGWMCLSCHSTNPPGRTSCAKEGCFRAGPNPSGLAAKLLATLQGTDDG